MKTSTSQRRRPTRAELNTALADLAATKADLARITADRDRHAERADFFVGLAVECAERCQAMAAESDNLAAAAARALPDLAEPFHVGDPWAEAPLFEAVAKGVAA